MRNRIKTLVLILSGIFFAGCDTGIQQMGPTQHGIVVRRLPPSLGGGVSDKVVDPGQTVIVWPWDAIYRLDTAVQYISWGERGRGTDPSRQDFVYTRALDGNEVALAVTVQYHLDPDKAKLLHLIRNVATSNQDVFDIVETVARADIRTHMNTLRTTEFFDRDARYRAIEKVKEAMSKRLNKEGIVIDSVILDEHRFERLLPDGKVDRSYQEKIDDTQKLGQDTERELRRIETVRAQKQQELNDTQAVVNRQLAESKGYKDQCKSRGDSYLERMANKSKQIVAKGKTEVEALSQQIRASAGKGGKSLLKLEVVKEILRQDPKFLLLDDSSSPGIDVKKIDTNELIKQMGVVEALKEKSKGENIKE